MKLELATQGDRRKELEIPRLREGLVVGKSAEAETEASAVETQAPAENASDPSRFCLIWKILLRP